VEKIEKVGERRAGAFERKSSLLISLVARPLFDRPKILLENVLLVSGTTEGQKPLAKFH